MVRTERRRSCNAQFSRLAIVNRGEPAMRADPRRPRAQRAADRADHADRALHRERARRDVRPPRRRGGLPRPKPRRQMDTADDRSGYLDHGALERALRASRADAAWVGWGFVAEQPEFAELCERLGIVFVGPDAACDAACSATRSPPSGWPRRLASRSRRGAAAPSRAPRRPSRTPSGSASRLMIKAAAGGGGRGIRRVDDARRARRRVRERPRERRCRRSATARCCSRS